MDLMTSLAYLVASVLFILSLRGLSHPETARDGLRYGMIGMVIAILTTVLAHHLSTGTILMGIAVGGVIGTLVALKIQMTALPQLVAAFHSLVGLAAVCVAAAAFSYPAAFGILGTNGIKLNSQIEMALGAIIGAVTFTGSIVAWAKLQGVLSGKPLRLPLRHTINAGLTMILLLLTIIFCLYQSGFILTLMIILSFGLGLLLVLPIGGADMPVIVSMLNSYSGWAAVGIGFTLENPLLIITGALVGSSGAILSFIMCRAMNRSFLSVLLGGFASEDTQINPQNTVDKNVKIGAAEDAGYIMKNAKNVIIVPGYGMAVSQAQHVVRELSDTLKKNGVTVKFAIHPVAGRMPGHMNVLLAEAHVPYDDVFELDDINREFSQTDVVYVIGANDITNPAARNDPSSPIYGMPVLDVERAQTVLFVKRSLASGYAGIDNPLFYEANTMMLLGDAKKMTEEIIKAMV